MFLRVLQTNETRKPRAYMRISSWVLVRLYLCTDKVNVAATATQLTDAGFQVSLQGLKPGVRAPMHTTRRFSAIAPSVECCWDIESVHVLPLSALIFTIAHMSTF